ncbi:hypothetical protein F5B20DRAFT_161519 [Whalleya microplaca]|nr:hypothetical protein F5B20DRAFT_161519 [Whalleya microplaca]
MPITIALLPLCSFPCALSPVLFPLCSFPCARYTGQRVRSKLHRYSFNVLLRTITYQLYIQLLCRSQGQKEYHRKLYQLLSSINPSHSTRSFSLNLKLIQTCSGQLVIVNKRKRERRKKTRDPPHHSPPPYLGTYLPITTLDCLFALGVSLLIIRESRKEQKVATGEDSKSTDDLCNSLHFCHPFCTIHLPSETLFRIADQTSLVSRTGLNKIQERQSQTFYFSGLVTSDLFSHS